MDHNFLKEIGYCSNHIERIERLISRGGAVAFALDELEKKGIDIVTQFDADDPILIKRKLKRKAPPVLFYSGDISLAKKIGIGIVGSRSIDDAGVQFTQKLVEKAAEEHLVIYSGGAKGIDTVSERAARAMNRNKYIYASSYGTFVVASNYNTGGTWAGAVEALKNEWTKVLVWQNKQYLEHIGEGMTKEEAADVFQVAKGQMNIWLKQLCQDSRLKCVKGRYIKP